MPESERESSDLAGDGADTGRAVEDAGAGGMGNEPGGPPARRLREFLRRQFGEVPKGSPTEHAEEVEESPAGEDEVPDRRGEKGN
jgi:hypothetical protein